MKTTKRYWIGVSALVIGALVTSDGLAQRGRGGGGGGGGRSAGHRSPSASRGAGHGPAMSRPQPKAGGASAARASRPASPNRSAGAATANRAGGGAARPGAGAGSATAHRGANSYQRPGGSRDATPGGPNNRPQVAGTGRPQPGAGNRPRPGGAPSAAQLDDFLGNQPGSRPGASTAIASNTRPGTSNRPTTGTRPATDNRLPNANQQDRTRIADNRANTNVGDRNRTNIDNRQVGGSREVNVGEVNIGNTVNFSQNRQAWVDNRHATADRVRVNAGGRYANAYRDGEYRRGVVGGYGYYSGWSNQGSYYGWRVPTYAAIGGFIGASLANAQPVYYGYGDGGNVYYENNTVYVEGQPAGTPEQYAQQALDYVAAAPPPDQVPQEEWLPLGVFVLSREDAADSQAMLELAVNKQGVLAGTYYNESTSASRPLKGTVDQMSQRAVVGFADGKNADLALETGIYNLTQDEAPALLHHGTEESTPVLLVRLPAPENAGGN